VRMCVRVCTGMVPVYTIALHFQYILCTEHTDNVISTKFIMIRNNPCFKRYICNSEVDLLTCMS